MVWLPQEFASEPHFDQGVIPIPRLNGVIPDLGADEFLCFVRLNNVLYPTVQAALDVSASPADVVQVAGTCRGVQTRTAFNYQQVVYITKTLTLRGGYNADFSVWDPQAYSTTLDALEQGRAVFIKGAGDIAPTLEALRLTNGRMDSESGGGIYALQAQPTISACHIYKNSAANGGGAMFWTSDGVVLINSEVYQNRAGGNGGGLFFWGSSNARLTNNIVADNWIADNQYGAGMNLFNSSVQLAHNTLARNRGGHGQGFYLANGAAITAANTILVGHTAGIEAGSGNTAVMTATLWGAGAWANTYDWLGSGAILTGTINVWGDPAFTADYRLNQGSAAIDRGVEAGVVVDIDGDGRPFGASYDIGADEFDILLVYLPLVLNNQ